MFEKVIMEAMASGLKECAYPSCCLGKTYGGMSVIVSRLESVDTRLLYLIHNGVRCTILDRILPFLTNSAGATAAISLAILILSAGLVSGFSVITETGLRMAAALATSHLVVHSIKRFANRARPAKTLNIRDYHVAICAYSFPSGHSSAAFALAACLLPIGFAAGLPAILWAGTVAFSRMYLGLHYTTDVVAGVLIGSFFGTLACGLINL